VPLTGAALVDERTSRSPLIARTRTGSSKSIPGSQPLTAASRPVRAFAEPLISRDRRLTGGPDTEMGEGAIHAGGT
jgi:hypothetical protein